VLRERERERERGREGGRQLEVAKNSTGTVKLKPKPAPKTIFCWVLSFS
jgi:hypothetical protein